MDKLLSLISYRGTVPLTSSFNHSLMKKRLIMMTRSKPSKVNVGIRIFMTLNLSVVFFLLMSFKNSNAQPLTSGIIYEVPGSSEQVTKDVKGFVVNKYGKYLQGIPIIVSGKNTGITTDNMGRFIISNVPEDASLTFSSKGYISQTIKPAFSSEMVVKLVLAQENLDPVNLAMDFVPSPGTNPLIVIDGVIEERVSMADIDPNNGVSSIIVLKGKDASDKYGEIGKNGIIEILTIAKSSIPSENKIPVSSATESEKPLGKRLLVVDGIVSTKELSDIPVEEIKVLRSLSKWSATDKYGEKGNNGAIEIITKKKDPKSGNLLLDPLNTSSDTVNQEVTYSAAGDIDVDNINKVVTLIGSAIVKYRDIEINADSIIINTGTNSIFAAGIKDASGIIRGTPVFKEGSQEFEADEITYNLETHKALIKNINAQEQKTINDISVIINKDTINLTNTIRLYYPNPLYIVNGIKQAHETNDNKTLFNLYTPNKKKIQLFKDEEQVFMFGVNVRNGVILVTKKSGISKN
jgi:lipopolysaccharide export system protein LptA